MQTVTIGQFVKQWTPGATAYKYPTDKDVILYRIGDGSIVLYIGITLRGINTRLREHLGLAYHAPSGIGMLIERMLPESADWPIDLFTTEELRTLLRSRWQHRNIDHWRRQDIAEVAEGEMIQSDRPCLNCHGNLDPQLLPERYR